MKLDYDIVRDILIALEEELSIEITPISDDNIKFSYKSIKFTDLCNRLSKSYSKEDVLYALIKLSENDYIHTKPSFNSLSGAEGTTYSQPIPNITSITYQGHYFLSHINDDTTWAKIKSLAIEESTKLSFTTILSLASKAITMASTGLII